MPRVFYSNNGLRRKCNPPYIYKYPHHTKQILGISYAQFLLLVKQEKLRHKERQAEAEAQKVRINSTGGGRKLN
ncbi:hypothetical protein PQG02_09040 [Nostoc sp. UHCC 0926]|uniref:hypothetical protein n=1 Tax=unclassified Nostoc TaxID=2593658 RepID=UPI00235F7CFA|nr:hypothetical protein [Nostoc sp. UHCC 0926]WDD34451.1 hypothetical protein PQG02_09040 [Nostoc sp. UHCC 0926]